ncbi:MAG: PHB depolymerase family esterase [Bacteroidota bacterium]
MKLTLLIFVSVLGMSSAYCQANILDSLLHQDFQRKYLVHTPPGYDNDDAPVPAILFLHGGGGNIQSAQGFTRFNFVSNAEGFLMIYPQGYHSFAPESFTWADGRNGGADQAGIDDVGFLNKLLDTLMQDYSIDENRIYLCGFSNGSFMTQRMAFEANDRFAAMGTLGGTLQESYLEESTPGRAIPMAYFFGTDDPFVPYDGGIVAGSGTLPVLGVEEAVDYWVENNDCQTALPEVFLPDIDTSDHSTVSVFEYTDCACQNAQVIFYKMEGAGHTWAGVELVNQEPVLGETNEDIFASRELWEFFSQFSLCDITSTSDISPDQVDIRVFPNPASGRFTIDSKADIDFVAVHNFSGQLIQQHKPESQELQLDLSQWPSGVYTLQLFISGMLHLDRIIIH